MKVIKNRLYKFPIIFCLALIPIYLPSNSWAVNDECEPHYSGGQYYGCLIAGVVEINVSEDDCLLECENINKRILESIIVEGLKDIIPSLQQNLPQIP